jgi:shikimate dehydrogenase
MPSGRRCAVLGSPIAHSLSPLLHRAAYVELGLDWEYGAHDVTEATLVDFVDGLDESWRGLSLTMPLKRAVVPLLDQMSERAEQARAANTVILEDGRRIGHNTDIPGFAAALNERPGVAPRSAVVLGGGATATSALLALADLGCRRAVLVVRDARRTAETIAAVNRHPTPPELEMRDLDDDPVSADLLVSTIPARAQTPSLLPLVDRVAAVFDVVYDPWPTPFAQRAREGEQVLVSGFDLLVHQAVLQIELMTGRRPSVATLRAELPERVR